jgi:hypothetical protein
VGEGVEPGLMLGGMAGESGRMEGLVLSRWRMLSDSNGGRAWKWYAR